MEAVFAQLVHVLHVWEDLGQPEGAHLESWLIEARKCFASCICLELCGGQGVLLIIGACNNQSRGSDVTLTYAWDS